MLKVKEKIRAKLYSEETHGLLNYLTLTIADKEISKDYEKLRTDRFNSMFWPQIFLYASFNIFGWLSYFQGKVPIESAQRPLHQVPIVLI
jgi:hypothetical protein